jgi:sugar-specific transcriptional regulator TrmB
MVQYSELQKRIALLLMHEPKTAEDLNKQLNIPYSQLMEELKGMLKLDLISKEGFPTYYKLKENIAQEIQRRKALSEKDENKIRLKAIIEFQSVKKDSLASGMKKVKDLLESEPDFQVYAINEAEVIQEGEHYSSYFDINLSLKDFRAITKLIFSYSPSSIEVLKPRKIEITADDLQDSLVDMSDIVQSYLQTIQKFMNKSELETFREKVVKK